MRVVGTGDRRAHATAFAALSTACVVCLMRSAQLPVAAAELPAAVAAGTPPEAAPAPPPDEYPLAALGAAIDDAVSDAIADQQVPGAVVVVGRRDRVLFRRAYGHSRLQPDPEPATLHTLYDLASLTKPVATATSLLVLAERGALGLDDPLAKYVPECTGGGKGAITLRQLLLHLSGLPADTPLDDFAHGRDEAIRRICSAPLRAAPGARFLYSDVGFVLLGEVVRRVSGQELAAFVKAAIFAPLGMNDTGFSPSEERRARAAWTERVDGMWRAGVVHDPRAFRLGGVAGHAGLFGTADDLALFARMLLGRGELDGRRVLSARSVAAMTAPRDVPGAVRTLGWQVDGHWRGTGLSPRTFGHTGFTGTSMWIDPDRDLFAVVLSNRVHPDGTGDAKPLRARVDAAVAQILGAPAGFVDECPARSGLVRTGIDVLREERFERLRGAHVGLITNASGVARDGSSTVDLFASAPGVTLVALFSPEHGLNADREGKVASGTDEHSGLPVYSLYGDSFAPTPESLAGIDTLVFDIQDAGARFYTYGSTMRRAMQVARDRDLRFVVLDRPNPIDGVDVEGPVLAASTRSFVNYHPLPVRHGMTMGELATLFDADDGLGVALSIVPMRGWRRGSYHDETGLPWVNPSPNLRRVEEALLYPALGLLEGTNLSVGRGTDAPFERLGAPWLDSDALVAALAAESLPGVAFATESFTPSAARYAGQACRGVHVTVRDRARFEPVRTGLAIARALRRLHPGDWDSGKLAGMVGDPAVVKAIDEGLPLVSIVEAYQPALSAFASRRERYLLYRDREDCAPGAR